MPENKTISYYNTIGSRLGYKLVAGGHRHFGYYKDHKYWYIPHAAQAMIDHLAEYAEIKPKDKILDAGCGEGQASLRIAENYNAEVTGIDLVPQSIKVAKKRANKTKAKVTYLLADYNKLPFDDKTFDVVFTLETFTHSPNPEMTIREFWRVLKPGGKIIIFDYSIKNLNDLTVETRSAIENIAKGTNCPSFSMIFHEYYDNNLPLWGITNFEVVNQTKSVMRSLNQIYVLSWLPFHAFKMLGYVNNHPNTLIAHFGKPWAKNDTWRYINLKILKPLS